MYEDISPLCIRGNLGGNTHRIERSVNPAGRLGKLKEKRIAEIDPFSDQEVKELLKAVLPRYKSYAEFLFESGFKPNEAMGLKWTHVNLATSILSVRDGRVLGKDKDPKTEAAIRDVEITSGMMRALKRQRAPFVFGPQLRFCH